MPQMSPLWWLMLFMLFSVTLILLTVLNYFIIINKPMYSEQSSQPLQSKFLPWMW